MRLNLRILIRFALKVLNIADREYFGTLDFVIRKRGEGRIINNVDEST